METLFQALEIIFELQRKRSNEKITREKNSFEIYNLLLLLFYYFSVFFSLEPFYFQTS
jgi:hypothetical protein